MVDLEMVHSQVKDKDIVKEIRRKNVYALVSWFRDRKSVMYRIASAYCQSCSMDAVFKGAIINIFKNIKSLKGKEDFEYWAVDMFLDECRKACGQKDVATQYGPSFPDNDGDIIKYVRTLDGKEKDVVILKYHGGYSIREIALILKIPEGEVRHSLYTGIKNITERAGEKS
ncbi:MAG: sigma factor-like helix-turn-helix DNA-binding protein [Clostridiales bacterium]|nr:sigma factor-like helix-turn-helix DNA-binding protein [Clostridiales bacterium]